MPTPRTTLTYIRSGDRLNEPGLHPLSTEHHLNRMASRVARIAKNR